MLCLGRAGVAQTLNFDPPLRVTQVRLPLNHLPVVVACDGGSGMVQETRYWQKNIGDDGVFFVHLTPGRPAPPSCDKVIEPYPTPMVVTCSVYAGFMVQGRHVEGDEGDAGTFIVPIRPGQATPACDDKAAPGEFLLPGTDQSGASFWGAVNGYVFLDLPDADPAVGYAADIFGANGQGSIITINVLEAPYVRDAPGNRLSRVPGGFDLSFMTDQTLGCGVGGSNGAACFARLEQASGAAISMAQCVKAEPENDPNSPVFIQYPALLSVRGSKAVLRATGPATRCIDTPY